LDCNEGCFGLQWRLRWTSMEPVLKRNVGPIAVQNSLRCGSTNAPLECEEYSVRNNENDDFRISLCHNNLANP